MNGTGENFAAATQVPRARRKPDARQAPGQAVLGWLALAVPLLAVLQDGGRVPLVETLLVFAALLLFAFQVAHDFQYGLPLHARGALVLALPWFAVLGWLLVQTLPGLPPDLAHPVWEIAPEGARPTISAHADAGWQLVMRFTAYTMLFWIVMRAAGAAPHGAIAHVNGIALFSTALALYGLFSWISGYNILLGDDEPAAVVQASFTNRNTYATFAIFGILANITAYVVAMGGSKRGAERLGLRNFIETFFVGAWLYAFGAMVGLVALVLTASRAGNFAGLVGILVLIWGLRRRSGSGAGWAVLAIPAALVGFALVFMSATLVDRIQLGYEADGRTEIFREVVVGVFDRPMLGHGGGAFATAFRPYVPFDQAAWDWIWAHNSYLENAFEFGLPAVGLFYLVLVLIGWRLYRGVISRRRHQGAPVFALACFVAAGFHAGLDFSLQFPALAALFAVILGIGWGQSFPTANGRRKRA